MRDVIIQGALSGLVFFAIGSWYYKAQQKSLKKKITKKISSGDFSKEDILAMINYHTNTDDEKIEGLRYISIAEKKFPKDKEIDEGIFSYYLNTLNFKAAIEKVQERINENPNDADSFYAKGFCYYKFGDKEMSNECRDKAIEIDKSYINKKYI
jgi:tetratricopeptide (TPR) repeat protein